MAVLTIEFDNLANGQEITLPFEVSATISDPSGTVGLSAAAGQIDDNTLHDLPVTIPPPTELPHTVVFDVTSSDCPDPNTWYLLTVYAWDNTANDPTCTMQSVTFKRIGLTFNSSPSPLPPPPPCP